MTNPDPHTWRPLPTGDRMCALCLRVEERRGAESRGGNTTYRGGLGYTTRLHHFPGRCVPKYDAGMREWTDA